MKKPINPLGLYLRNGIWWTSWRFGKRRIRIFLKTCDVDQASERALEARSRPEAYLTHALADHITAYLDAKRAVSKISEATAYQREQDLRNFVAARSFAEPRDSRPPSATSCAVFRNADDEPSASAGARVQPG